MSEPVNIYDAKARLSELIDRASRGEEVVIARAGKPLVRLVPVQVRERTPGKWKGKVRIAPDFDDPLPDEILRDFGGPDE
jgi:prevent-host-death family protein